MKKIRKNIAAVSLILFSIYFSFLFAFGMVLGYISTRVVHKKMTKDWGVNSVKIKLGNFRLHFHHWLMGGMALLLFWLFGILDSFPKLIVGMQVGLIAQGIYDYSDWHRIIAKNDN